MPSVFDPLFEPLVESRPRGGWRQRPQWAESIAAENVALSRSYTFERHVLSWAQGFISAPMLWSLVQGTVLDGLSHPALIRISRLAKTYGDSNTHQNLLNLFARQCNLNAYITEVAYPVVGVMVLPSSFCRLVHGYKPDKFRRHMGADRTQLRFFWSRLFESSAGQELRNSHPGLRHKTPAELECTVPCVLHQDAGPFSKRRSTMLVSWSSILGFGADITTKYSIFSYIKHAGMWVASGSGAWHLFLRDSENVEQGLDQHGQPFAKDDDSTIWKLCFIFTKSDGEVVHIVLGLQGWSGVHECCSHCKANRSDMPWSDLRPNALWKHVELTQAEWLARVRGGHPLHDSRLWNRQFVRLDMMHLLDCKGYTAIISGSVLHLLAVGKDRLGTSISTRMVQINIKIEDFYRRNPCSSRIKDLRYEDLMHGGDKWIELGGKMIKSAATRHTAPFLVYMAELLFDGRSQHHASVRAICKALHTIYQFVYTDGTFLSEAAMTTLCDSFTALGVHH